MALNEAEADTTRPSIIVVRTTIGYGSPKKQGTSEAHGSPLGPDEVAAAKKTLGFDPAKSFYIPPEAGAHLRSAVERGAAAQAEWDGRFARYATAFPDLAAEWTRTRRKLPAGWDEGPRVHGERRAATRQAGQALNAIAARVPERSARRRPSRPAPSARRRSTARVAQAATFTMGCASTPKIANGITYHGGLRTFTATFFASRTTGVQRCAGGAEQLPVTFVWTHDSIALRRCEYARLPSTRCRCARCRPRCASRRRERDRGSLALRDR
jgi:transketolase